MCLLPFLMQLPFQKVNEEVFLATDAIVRFDKRAVEFIKEKALSSKRGRARICAHKSNDDSLHEMLIAIRSDSYIRPHRHFNKVESFHLVEGKAKIVIFDNEGNIRDVIDVGDYDSGKKVYYRIDHEYFHTVLVESDFLVFHEVIQGPFKKESTVFAPWSPEEIDAEAIKKYMEKLNNNIGRFLSKK